MGIIDSSIIIPAWHEETVIGETLQALKNLDYDLKRCEVIVVASADDETYNISNQQNLDEFGRYLVLKQEHGGKNTAIQQGIKISKGEFIVLLDADSIVEKNWLSELIKIAKSSDCATVDCFRFQSYKNFITRYYAIREIKEKCINKSQGCGGPSLLIKRKIIDRVGIDVLFNKNIFVAVDALVTFELKKRGYELGFSEKTKLDTQMPQTIKEFIIDELRWHKGVSQIRNKNDFFKVLGTNLVVFLSLLSSVFSIFYFNYLAFISYSILLLFILKQAYTFLVVFNYSKKPYWRDFLPHLLIDLISVSITSMIYLKLLFSGAGKKKLHFKGRRPKEKI